MGIVDQSLPPHRGARLLEVDPHHHDEQGAQALGLLPQPGRGHPRRRQLLNRTRPEPHHQPGASARWAAARFWCTLSVADSVSARFSIKMAGWIGGRIFSILRSTVGKNIGPTNLPFFAQVCRVPPGETPPAPRSTWLYAPSMKL